MAALERCQQETAEQLASSQRHDLEMAEIRNGLARLIQATEAWTETARTNSDRISALESQ